MRATKLVITTKTPETGITNTTTQTYIRAIIVVYKIVTD